MLYVCEANLPIRKRREGNCERQSEAWRRRTCAVLDWGRAQQMTRPRQSIPIHLPGSSAAWGWELRFWPPPGTGLRYNWAGRCMSPTPSPSLLPCVPFRRYCTITAVVYITILYTTVLVGRSVGRSVATSPPLILRGGQLCGPFVFVTTAATAPAAVAGRRPTAIRIHSDYRRFGAGRCERYTIKYIMKMKKFKA